MPTYRLNSNGLVHTPGILAWAQNGYAFQKDRKSLLKIFTETWPTIPSETLDRLLKKEITHKVIGETVEFKG